MLKVNIKLRLKNGLILVAFSVSLNICLPAFNLHDNHYIMNTGNRVKRQLLLKEGFEINCLVRVASGDWKKFWKCSPEMVFLFFKYDKKKWMFWTLFYWSRKNGPTPEMPKGGWFGSVYFTKNRHLLKTLKKTMTLQYNYCYKVVKRGK